MSWFRYYPNDNRRRWQQKKIITKKNADKDDNTYLPGLNVPAAEGDRCLICEAILNAATVQCNTATDQRIFMCKAGFYGNVGDAACVQCPPMSITDTGVSIGATSFRYYPMTIKMTSAVAIDEVYDLKDSKHSSNQRYNHEQQFSICVKDRELVLSCESQEERSQFPNEKVPYSTKVIPIDSVVLYNHFFLQVW